MLARHDDKAEARRLRSTGKTLAEIASAVSAGKGLVSLWVRGVVPDVGAVATRKAKRCMKTQAAVARAEWSRKCRESRDGFREEGRQAARQGSAAHALACALYWGEGTKSKNVAQMVNSDINILRIFLEFCRDYFEVSPSDVSMKVAGYTQSFTREEMIEYWVHGLGLEASSHRAHSIDVFKYVSKGVSGSK